MTTTRTPRPAADWRRQELAPLGRRDRLALAVGLRLMLWSHRHAERAADAARTQAAREQSEHDVRQAFVQRTWIGPRW